MSESLADVVHEAVERAKADEAVSDLDPAAVMAEHRDDHGSCKVCREDTYSGPDLVDWPCEPYRLASALSRVTAVLDEAYREDVGLATWSQHPELGLPQRYEAWLDEEERQGR